LLTIASVAKVSLMKRYFLLILILLAACNSAPEPEVAELSPIQIIVVSSDFALDEARVSFALFDGTEPVTDVTAVTVSAYPIGEEVTEPVWSGPATNYTDYIVPYWVAYPDLPSANIWGLVATMTRADGTAVESQFVIDMQAESKAPAIGEAAPPSENRTLATEPDISKLSSGTEADPALYQMTVKEAVASGRPSVVGFITPGLCQTQWCAPVLESVAAVRNETGDEAANFIHIEVYQDFQTLSVVPQMGEWGLDTEPWVFVLDENGRVTAKFNGPLAPKELTAALADVLP
jgi:hypothetical protein